jgi:hypothetical protein
MRSCTRRIVYAESVRGVLLDDKVNEIFFKKILKPEKSLQARGNYSKNLHHFSSLLHLLKRASLTLSACIKGVVTIEAAIAIPIFMFCFLEIMSLFNYISTYSGILYAMKQVGDPVCIHGYAYDMIMEGAGEQKTGEQVVSTLIFSEGYLDAQLRKKCSDIINEKYIKNGIKGISLLGSYINRDSGAVSIVARYVMKPVFSIAGTEHRVISRYYGRLWTGYSLEESEIAKAYVYVTESGSVYHLSKDCTYLKLSISNVQLSELDEKRNDSGARYKPCEICFNQKRSQELYYITNSGNRYHSDLGCFALKRTIYRIELAEVDQRSVCSRCSQGE